MTHPLIDFLTARLDEDEQRARAAVGAAVFTRQTGTWDVHDQLVFAVAENGARTQVADLSTAWEPSERAVHIAHHDPARVLADVAAKRALIGYALQHLADIDAEHGCCHSPAQLADQVDDDGDPLRCGLNLDQDAALLALALPYADHPGYQQEWTP